MDKILNESLKYLTIGSAVMILLEVFYTTFNYTYDTGKEESLIYTNETVDYYKISK